MAVRLFGKSGLLVSHACYCFRGIGESGHVLLVMFEYGE